MSAQPIAGARFKAGDKIRTTGPIARSQVRLLANAELCPAQIASESLGEVLGLVHGDGLRVCIEDANMTAPVEMIVPPQVRGRLEHFRHWKSWRF